MVPILRVRCLDTAVRTNLRKPFAQRNGAIPQVTRNSFQPNLRALMRGFNASGYIARDFMSQPEETSSEIFVLIVDETYDGNGETWEEDSERYRQDLERDFDC